MIKKSGSHFKIKFYSNLGKKISVGFRFQNQYKEQILRFAKGDILGFQKQRKSGQNS